MSIEEDIRIETEDFSSELTSLPLLFFKYLEEQDIAESSLKKKKLGHDILEAELSQKIRLEHKSSGAKKSITESQVSAMIKSSSEWQTSCDKVLQAELYKKAVSSICRSLEMKRDSLKMLVSIRNSEYYTTSNTEPVPFKNKGSRTETGEKSVRQSVRCRLKRKQKKENKGA